MNPWQNSSDAASSAHVHVGDTASPTGEAGEIAIAIAELADNPLSLSAIAQSVAIFLADRLHADASVIYQRQLYLRRGADKPTLRALGNATARVEDAELAAQRLTRMAYRGLIGGRLVERFERRRDLGGETSVRHIVALPISGVTSEFIVALEWNSETESNVGRTAQVLTLCVPTLTLALRSAQHRSEVQQAEKSAKPRRSVFALTSEAVVSIGEDLTILEINPAFGRVLGWQESFVLGRSCSDILRCRDGRNALLCSTARCPVRVALDAEIELPVVNVSWETASGRRRDVSASSSVHHTPTQSQVVLVARDVTALSTADRMRSNFISMVSHELRTPLNSINGFLEIVAEEQVGPLNERQREFLGYARQSTQQLTTLVEDILFITKADSGEFKLRWTDVEIPHVVAQATMGQAAAAQKGDVRVIAHVPEHLPTLRADELRLQQVLNNLLSNAIKFSPPDSNVELTIWRDGDTMYFAVQDQGVGVAPDDQARIFERFFQAETALRTRGGGYGLGLAIAKLIVEQHGGLIWVESEPGSGAKFCFSMPILRLGTDSLAAE